MTDAATEDLVRSFFRALQRGEVDELERLLAANVVWTAPGPIPQIGLVRPKIEGRSAFFEAARETAEYTSGSLQFAPQQVLANGGTAVVVSRNTAERGDEVLDLEMIFLLRVQAGEIIEVTEFPQSVGDWARFWT